MAKTDQAYRRPDSVKRGSFRPDQQRIPREDIRLIRVQTTKLKGEGASGTPPQHQIARTPVSRPSVCVAAPACPRWTTTDASASEAAQPRRGHRFRTLRPGGRGLSKPDSAACEQWRRRIDRSLQLSPGYRLPQASFTHGYPKSKMPGHRNPVTPGDFFSPCTVGRGDHRIVGRQTVPFAIRMRVQPVLP